MDTRLCSVSGCGRDLYQTELCRGHYARKRKGQPLTPLRAKAKEIPDCSLEFCGRISESNGLCSSHARQKRQGKEFTNFNIQKVAQGHVNPDGYRIMAGHSHHPNAYKNGSIAEHVCVMSQKLGRPLLPGENVHHLNGVRDDNRPENLELWVTNQPSGQRPEDLVKWAKEIIERYGDDNAGP